MQETANARPTTSPTWQFRNRLTVRGRRRARRVADKLLRPLNSISGVHTTDQVVALTFDDGPDPLMTPRVLDALKDANTHATFFVLANRAIVAPALIERIGAEGHELALHGLEHTRVTRRSVAAIAEMLRTARSWLEPMAQQRVQLFRPPFGAQSLRSYWAARQLGLQVVMWSQECGDWLPQSEAEVATLTAERAAPGSIVLLHDGLVPDPDRPTPPPQLDRGTMVTAIIAALAARGFATTTVSNLLTLGRPHTTAWFRP